VCRLDPDQDDLASIKNDSAPVNALLTRAPESRKLRVMVPTCRKCTWDEKGIRWGRAKARQIRDCPRNCERRV